MNDIQQRLMALLRKCDDNYSRLAHVLCRHGLGTNNRSTVRNWATGSTYPYPAYERQLTDSALPGAEMELR